MRKGFTLLELLIVVVIVGILAAIAVPQFFKIAERARASEGVHALGALRSSQLRYYSEHGFLTDQLVELDTDFGVMKFFSAGAPAAPVYVQGAEVLGTVTRDPAASNPGYGAYTLDVHGNGDVTCAGTARCTEIGF